MMELLGDDVIYELTCWMSVKELLAFGQTNKRFLNITSDEHLWRKYEDKLMHEIYTPGEDEEPFPDEFKSETMKTRIRFLTNWNDYSKENGTALASIRDWAYYVKRPLWGLDLLIRIFFAMILLSIERIKVMYQLNLDQASWNLFSTIKYVYDTEGIGGYFSGWPYRLMLVAPFLVGGSFRRYSVLTIYFSSGLELRTQLGYHIDSYLNFVTNIAVLLFLSAFLNKRLRGFKQKMALSPSIFSRDNILKHIFIYLNETIALYMQCCQFNAFQAIFNFIWSLFSRMWLGFALYGVRLLVQKAQYEAIKYKSKLSDIEKEKKIYKKYLNKPFQIKKLRV